MDRPFKDPAVDPVLCSPYDPPDRHWRLDEFGRADRTYPPLDGRREPLRISVPSDMKATDQVVLRLDDRETNKTISDIRKAVSAWRDNGFEGTTSVTRRLLWHWTDPQATRLRPFFAQVEAIETFIWLREAVNRSNPGLIGAQARSRSTRSCCISFGKCRNSRYASVVIGFAALILFVGDPRLLRV